MSELINSVLAQYEQNKQAASGNKVSKEERLKKYFSTVLKGTRSAEKRVRILPTKDGSSPFVEVFFHEIQVNGEWVKLYDPAQVGERSPLNEVREALLETGKETDKKIASNYRSRKFYIVKIIDRENEQDGPKFWRFKYSYKNEGVIDKIFPIFKSRGDITDVKTGRDITLNCVLTKSGNGKEYTVINSVLPEDPSPLHSDPEIQKQWLEDELIWSDVYSKKSVDYLEIVANGETPKWNPDTKKWFSVGADESAISGTSHNSDDEPEDLQEDNENSNNDLPF